MFKILIVDDESLIRYSLSATFRNPSIMVRTASTGTNALLAISEEDFDVCILDLHLPDMSGLDIMRHIRSTCPNTKIIIITGEDLSRESRQLIDENAVLQLDKPFDLDRVRSVVHLIQSSRQTPANALPMNEERRQHARRVSNAAVLYSAVAPSGEAKAIGLNATLCDVSDSGMQLFTDHLLQPGWWLMVSNGNSVHHGVVRWSTAGRQQGSFHIGMQIDGPAA